MISFLSAQISRRTAREIILLGLLFRAILVGFAALQDAFAEVSYTDIDYQVFTDAAHNVYQGLSPYAETTAVLREELTKYRYTPFLAWLLVPNVWLACFGKLLFSLLDIVGAYVLLDILERRAEKGSPADVEHIKFAMAFFLFNPFTAAISTRGSGESIVLLAFLLMFWFLQRRWDVPAALCFGFVVHWRFWPIIFVVPIIFRFGVFSVRTIRFGIVSGGLCLALCIAAYLLYGFEFVDKCYLYHLSRVDTKHNFSIGFYSSRFMHDNFIHWAIVFALSKVKLASIVFLGVQDQQMERVLLRQTIAFVAFNGVVTAQYHFWWLQLIPLVWWRRMKDPKIAKGLAIWAITQLHWLFWAFLYEIRSLPVVYGVWAACWIFLAANLNLLRLL
eukprot:GEMP01008695.1.p1 GENE.GEMP01008695.1~~GEMP01008695.1.p1  ORF type:complete len:389 (+),score=39.64 GEMP01008695.1:42-1208(+)